MRTRQDTEHILDLVQDARTGRIVLPQFQRNFVWGRDEVTDLLISILNGYFIGSFLMLETDPEHLPFAIRPIQGVTLDSSYRPEWMILDGQQRLTSLNYVLAAPDIPMKWTKYAYRFFLNLNAIAEGDIENAVESERADQAERHGRYERQYQFHERIIPFTVLERWDEWLHAYETWLRDDPAAYDEYWARYRTPWHNMIQSLRNFAVPVISIGRGNPSNPEYLERVCAIFEKMNSTGVRLSVYDLLTARLYRDGIDLHSLWQRAIEQYPLLSQYSNGTPDSYGVFMLRTIALIRGRDVKSRSLINLRPQGFVEDWEAAAFFMEKALQRVTSTNADGFGVFAPKWMPYSTMVSPLAAMLHYIEENRLGRTAYEWLHRWYWASVFRERYAGTVESTTYRDYQDMLGAFHTGKTPQAIQGAMVDVVENAQFSLMDVNRVNAVYKSVMCLVALRGAKDFRTGDSIEFHELDDHHIFPRAYLRKIKQAGESDHSQSLVNCVLNRTLISSSTNRSISRSAPAAYLERIVPQERTAEIMDSHFIDANALEAMRRNDFEAFLQHRNAALVAEIRRRIS